MLSIGIAASFAVSFGNATAAAAEVAAACGDTPARPASNESDAVPAVVHKHRTV